MKVPRELDDCQVLYWLPCPEPESNGPDEPMSHGHALVECPMERGTYNAKRDMIDGRPPTQLFGVDVDANGLPLWVTDYWHESEEAFLEDLKRWAHGMPLLRPGDEIPDH